jgi:methylmalonyl-CoA/ethylmalonyl-CoA epimerase
MLGVPEKPEFDHPSSVIYFDVPDIEEAHRALAGRGVAFETEPHFVAPLGARDLWMAFFRDSEGNLMALQSERARG